MEKNHLTDTGELNIEIPALPRPTLEELKKEPCVLSLGNLTGVERDTSPIESVTLRLGTLILPGETSPNFMGGRIPRTEVFDAELRLRIAPHLNHLLGLQHADWLVAHQEELPAFVSLFKSKTVHQIDFHGTLPWFVNENYTAIPRIHVNHENQICFHEDKPEGSLVRCWSTPNFFYRCGRIAFSDRAFREWV